MPSVQTKANRNLKSASITQKLTQPPEKADTTSTTSNAQQLDPKEQIKAQARAYALSTDPNSKSPRKSRYQTPPLRPSAAEPPSTQPTGMSASAEDGASPVGVRRKITPQALSVQQGTGATVSGPESAEDDYQRFVRSLGSKRWEDDMVSLPSVSSLLKFPEEEDDEFFLDDDDESDDDDEEAALERVASSNDSPPTPDLNLPLGDAAQAWETNIYAELEQELGSLLEEDLEAAVSTLLGSTPETAHPTTVTKPAASSVPASGVTGKKSGNEASPNTPLRDAARQSSRTVVTVRQVGMLQQLMAQHYQLLLQQGILAVRAVQSVKVEKERSRRAGASTTEDVYHESPEDLAEIIDSAVGMLQDLDQNRKDAIRNFMQLEEGSAAKVGPSGKRSLMPQLSASPEEGGRRLTRSAFHQSLEDPNSSRTRSTLFDVQGLDRLKMTFEIMDQSYSKVRRTAGINILAAPDHPDACRAVMKQAGANFDQSMLPGVGDVSQVLSDAKEVFGSGFFPPATVTQQLQLRKNRNQFTAAEDNLILRGVNLYGEKQWLLIADRYLPDRSINIISQRYSKLCLMIYHAHDVSIDDNGNLKPIPKDMKHETLDEEALSKLKKVDPPAILNVHRWSIEEDLTLLKAVPLMGNMWAELSSRLIPHRDRGHLRKRYQVLDRRIQATVKRTKRESETPAAAVNRSGTKTTSRPPAPPKTYSNRKNLKTMAGIGFRAGNPQPLPHPGAPFARAGLPGPRPQPSMGSRMSPAKGPAGLVARGPAGLSSRASCPTSGSRLDASTDGNTRTGIERILNEATNDWSQMSRMKRLVDNDPESLVASAAASHVGNGRRGGDVDKLPSLEMDSASSSGLSMLGEASGVARLSPAKRTNGSIMANVLERAGKKSGDRQISPGKDGNGQVSGYDFQSTPSRPHPPRGISTFGTPTPVGFSPAVKSMYSPALPNGFSPGMGLKGFSPGSMMGPISNLGGGVVGGGSHDGFELSNFAISDRSKQALECNEELGRFKSAPLSAMSQPHTPLHAELLGDAHGLKDSDLEAISALNSLSNSPARFLLKRPADEMSKEEGKLNAGDTKMSLFAAVVGVVEKKQESGTAAKKRKGL